MFSDTVDGANASANLYALVETCKANGIDPYRYLTWLFQRLPLAKAVDDYDALLPLCAREEKWTSAGALKMLESAVCGLSIRSAEKVDRPTG